MYVCICKQVTDTQVKQAIAAGAKTLEELCSVLPIGTQCGRCCDTACEILENEATLEYCCQRSA